MRRFRPCRAMW